jgi:hypothetical protein
MPRIIEQIRNSAVSSNMMQFAAKGALLVPGPEMVEILVYLALHNKVFGEQARLTLAGWDLGLAREVAANPEAPREVLEYFIDPANLRPPLLAVLVENPSVDEALLVSLALTATREQVEVLLQSERVSGSREILTALHANANLREAETQSVNEKLAHGGLDEVQKLETETVQAADEPNAVAPPPAVPNEEDEILDAALTAYLSEHAVEIAAENDNVFEPASFADESGTAAPRDPISPPGGAVTSYGAAAAPARAAVNKKWILSADEQRGSALQKIARLDVKGRINLAVKGNKEERSILIRDGTKIVALAVLESPKVTDGEVEKFAGQKNVLEAVLRAIPMKRKFMKMYPVVRNLTFNPRTPIDVSLGLMKNLLVQDLRHLAGNKEVSDTVRKLALKMFRQKLDVTKK